MPRYRNYLIVVLLILLACLPASAQGDKGTEAAAPLPFVGDSWTLVLLPDTQLYAQDHPHIFTSQTRWIVENRASRNIAFVVHEGDITNNNNPKQWTNAKNSLSLLDGVVPYALAPGNHDYGPDGRTTTRDTLLNEYFPVSLFDKLPTFGGVYQRRRLDNSYHLFSAGGRNWLVLALEFGPRDGVVQWANVVLDRYSHRSAIIVTHAYMWYDDTQYDHTTPAGQTHNPHHYPVGRLPGSVNDGKELWDKLIYKHKNVAFVLCGHVGGDGAGRLTSTGEHGNPVHQLLANYQMLPEGGQGYLRLLEFLPDEKTVQVKTYSPYMDRYKTGNQQQFVLDLPPPPE